VQIIGGRVVLPVLCCQEMLWITYYSCEHKGRVNARTVGELHICGWVIAYHDTFRLVSNTVFFANLLNGKGIRLADYNVVRVLRFHAFGFTSCSHTS
jgi:hypothetical protein